MLLVRVPRHILLHGGGGGGNARMVAIYSEDREGGALDD